MPEEFDHSDAKVTDEDPDDGVVHVDLTGGDSSSDSGGSDGGSSSSGSSGSDPGYAVASVEDPETGRDVKVTDDAYTGESGDPVDTDVLTDGERQDIDVSGPGGSGASGSSRDDSSDRSGGDPVATVTEVDDLGREQETREFDTMREFESSEFSSGGNNVGVEDYQTIDPNAPEPVQRQQRQIQRQQNELVDARESQNTAEFQKTTVQNRIERLENDFEQGAEVQVGDRTVSREQRLSELRDQLGQIESQEQQLQSFEGSASQNVEEMRDNVDSLQAAAGSPFFNLASNAESQADNGPSADIDVRDLSETDNFNFQPAPTDDELTSQYPGGTNIPGGYTEGTPMANPEIRQDIVGQNRVIQTLGSSEGWNLLGGVLTGDEEAGQEAIESAVETAQSGDYGFFDFASSPAGVASLAVPAGAAGQATLRGVGAVSGTARAAAETGLLVGTGLYTGSQAAEAGQELEQGETAEAVGTGLQTTAELGGFGAGARATARRLAPRLGRTTVTDSDMFLSQRSQGTAVGGGSVEAETNLVTPTLRPWRDPAVETLTASSDDLLIQQTDEGVTAAGNLRMDQPGDEDAVIQNFFGTSRPIDNQPSAEDVTITSDRFELGDDPAQFGASRTVTESDETVDGFREIEFGGESTLDDGSRIIGGGRAVIDQAPRGSGGGSGGSGGAASSGSGSGGGTTTVQETGGDGEGILSGLADDIASGFRESIDTDPDPILPMAAAAPVPDGGSGQDAGEAEVAEADLAEESIFQEDISQSSQQVQSSPAQESILGSPASERQTVDGSEGLVERDPVLGPGTGTLEEQGSEERPDQVSGPSVGQGIESPAQEQGRGVIPGQAQGSSQAEGLDQGIFQSQGSVQTGETAQTQRSELGLLQQGRPGRPGRGRGRSRSPARPSLPSIFSDQPDGIGSQEDRSVQGDSSFAPSIEGLALGLQEEDVAPGDDPLLTGLEPRGIPSAGEGSGSEEEEDEEFLFF